MISKRLVIVFVSIASLLVAGGIALAAIPSGDGTIYACYKNNTGQLRVIDSEAGENCLNSETAIFWNQQGPQGPAGPPGADGNDGAPGLSGYERIQVPGDFIGPWISVDLTCPNGKKVLGGGYITGGTVSPTATIIQVSNAPNSDNGWVVRVYDPGNLITDLSAFAVCATVAP